MTIERRELHELPGGPVGNNAPAAAGDAGSIPGLGRFPE